LEALEIVCFLKQGASTMKRIIVILGLIASTGSIFFLPNKSLAENGGSNQKVAAMAIRTAMLGNNTSEPNYTATDEDGNQDDVDTGDAKTTSD
jgi:hypothetical protein